MSVRLAVRNDGAPGRSPSNVLLLEGAVDPNADEIPDTKGRLRWLRWPPMCASFAKSLLGSSFFAHRMISKSLGLKMNMYDLYK